MERKLFEVLRILMNHQQNIYVWVVTKPDATECISIKVPYDTARDWCIEYSNAHKGVVPSFVSGNDIFLGYMPPVSANECCGGKCKCHG